MDADLDFDIVAHFGYLRNVDLLSKGLYIVQVKLFYGLNGNLIAPVGMFSSPSSLSSIVQDQTLPAAPVTNMCEVDDMSRCFRTRSIVVRYKDERYELNDGVHWRLTLPRSRVAYGDETSPPHCHKPLHLKFELLFCPFLLLDPAIKVDLMSEIHKLIPDEPQFTTVATQNVVVDRASSGIHSYHPVHFNGANIVELDCMLHCAITGMRFPSLAPKLPLIDLATEPVTITLTSPSATPSASTTPIPTPTPAHPTHPTRPLPSLPSTPSSKTTLTTAKNKVTTPTPSTASNTEHAVQDELTGNPTTPVQTANPDRGSERDGASLKGNNDASGDAMLDTPVRRNSQRYVPVVSPHSTVLSSPAVGEPEQQQGQTVMQRMSGRMANWRKSVSAIASPTPIIGKVSEVGAASARKLSDLKAALSSPLAGAASMMRPSAGSSLQDETTTPARAEEQSLPGANNPQNNSVGGSGLSVSSLGDDLAGEAEEDPLRGESQLEERTALVDAIESLAPKLDPLVDPEGWFQAYAGCVISNYDALHMGIKSILDLYSYVQEKEESAVVKVAQSQALQALCSLQANKKEIIAEIVSSSDEGERAEILKEKIDLCNLHVSLHWSLLMTALRRVMPQLCPLLKSENRNAMRDFWRGQLLVQTKSVAGTQSYYPGEVTLLLDVVDKLILQEVREAEREVKVQGGSLQSGRLRALRIYDADLHKNVSKLPHMVLQQYVDAEKGPHKPTQAQIAAQTALGGSSVGMRIANTQGTGGVIGAEVVGGGKGGRLSILKSTVAAALTLAVPTLTPPAEQGQGGGGEKQLQLPPGTLLLARGGELLSDSTSQHCGVLRDGQIVDLSIYPALKPLLSAAVPTVATSGVSNPHSSSSNDIKAGKNAEGLIGLDVGEVEVSGLAGGVGSPDNSNRSDKGFGESAKSSKSSSCDFVAAHVDKNTTTPRQYVHLVVLQHGFLGQGYDMQLIENALRLEFPNEIETFVARSNEGKEHDSIAQMGKRLAFEVAHYCKQYHPELLKPGTKPRVSFIGHSMGGLIIRQALQEPQLQPMYSKLHTYISLATPHVGALFPDSQIVSTGMWALFKWKKYKALKELVLDDALAGKVSKTLLFKLSESKALSHFRRVVLVSSPKDQYVPAYSARIQTCQRSEADAALGSAVSLMVQNLLQPLRADQIVRITMDNNVGESTDVNSLIGRTAHICFLENPIAAKMLVYAIAPYIQ